jgi:undecaprenyl-diphosphatase
MTGAVLTGQSESIDSAGLLFWRHGAVLPLNGQPYLLDLMRELTAYGSVLVRNLIVLAAVTALILLRIRREAAILAGTIVSGWVLNSALKLIVGRPRPSIVPHLTQAGGHSFPSGHSFNSALVYIAIALVFAAMCPQRSVRWMLIGSAIVLSLSIAFTRVWLGVHYPSDVVAGWLGGAGWAFMAAAVLQKPVLAAASPTRGN